MTTEEAHTILDALARIWMDEDYMIHCGDSAITQDEYRALIAANVTLPWPTIESMRPHLAIPQASQLGGLSARMTASALVEHKRVGTGYCTCGARISANKDRCMACSLDAEAIAQRIAEIPAQSVQ